VNIWSSLLVSGFLLTVSSGLLVWHIRSWRQVQQQDPRPADFDYRRRQFRRRTQSTTMLAILAVALFFAQFLPPRPLVTGAYVGALVLVIFWVGLLALADVVATKQHFGRLRHDCLIEQAKLQAEMRRIQGMRRNGTSHHGRHPSGSSDKGGSEAGI